MNKATIQHKNTARVLLHEARARRGSAFSHVLLRWAGNARRRAVEAAQLDTAAEHCSALPTQQELFA
ncbi:hypothetical protein [Stenotrophomonas rhizophila]|uniref:hypothetical protein n=1 Tax=Stenotrophomonas rhizophila TaxID=216778 RepID=UPI0028CFF22A|nr:hypothetical protein [Stenotrophomonas rhizophila]